MAHEFEVVCLGGGVATLVTPRAGASLQDLAAKITN
jgi:hypothetical protein